MNFEQRLAGGLFLLLMGVIVYAMFTGQLDVSLAISAITGLVATIISGKTLSDFKKKTPSKADSDD